MTLGSLMTRSVTIRRADIADDRYGASQPNWEVTDDTVTTGWLSQTSSTEPEAAGRDPYVTSWVLYLPANTDILPDDRVEIDGFTYEVVGPPNRARRPAGEHHIEATLRLIEG